MKAFPIILLALFCTAGLCAAPVAASEVLSDQEILGYTVKWTSFSAGQIEMKTVRKPGDDSAPYEIHLEAKSNGFVSMFYKVDNTVQSHIAPNVFRSLYYYKDIKQGKRHIEEKTRFDYAGNVIHFSRQNLGVKGESAGLKDFPIEAKDQLVQDPLSLIYHLRTMDFKELGQESSVQVFADKGIYELRFKFIGRQSIATASFGNKDVLHVKPTAIYKGAFIDDGELELWLDQETRIPLRLKFSIPVGWATLELTSCNHPKLKPVAVHQGRRSAKFK